MTQESSGLLQSFQQVEALWTQAATLPTVRDQASDIPAVQYKMGDPRSGFKDGRFTSDNWHDPTIDFIRRALSREDNEYGVMRTGYEVERVSIDVGVPESDIEEQPAVFFCSQVNTALGRGVVLACPWHEDQTMVLVLPERKGIWYYVSWYKDRGATDKLSYMNMLEEGIFQEAEPVTYEDAAWLGHFLNSIQVRKPLQIPPSAFRQIIEKPTDS